MTRNRKRYALAALLAFVIATASFAFANSNTITDGGKAGIGDGPVSGYTVTNVKWNLVDATPDKVDSVTFDVGSAATEVFARALDGVGGAAVSVWTTCGNGGSGTVFTCTFGTKPNTVEVKALQVSSAS